MKMDLKQLIPELKKWDGKLPKQALYQTEPHPVIYELNKDTACGSLLRSPVAVPCVRLGGGAPALRTDRCHSLPKLRYTWVDEICLKYYTQQKTKMQS